MTDSIIRKAIDEGQLKIKGFSDQYLQAASYDLCLGDEAFISSRREKINPKDKGLLTIGAGDFAVVSTYEELELSPSIAGHIGLRSYYARRGLVALSGPQIDPGFRGKLVVGLCNLSPKDVIIPYRDPFCTVEFYLLNEPATVPYEGPYQHQKGIPAQDIENLLQAQGMTFGEVIKTLQNLSLNVQSLTQSVTGFKWMFGALMAIMGVGLTIIGVMIAFIR